MTRNVKHFIDSFKKWIKSHKYKYYNQIHMILHKKFSFISHKLKNKKLM